MKDLLVATDLSARSDRAMERAMELAREHGAKLTIVHVIDEDLPVALAESHGTAAQQAISQHVAKLSKGDQPDVSVEVLFGRAYLDVLQVAERTQAEMVIVGVHREDSFKDMFRGTTAERIIRASNVPVLLVKEQITGPYRKIMVGVDFSVYSRRAIEFAVKFAPDGEFHLVHAYDVPFKGFLHDPNTRHQIREEQRERFGEMVEGEMAAFLNNSAEGAPKFRQVLQEGTPREVIQRQAGRLKPDLLVIGTHGRTGVAHAFLGSVAEDLLAKPPCDVLAVKAW